MDGAKATVKLVMDADAAELLLKLAGSQRKQGEYVSRLVRAAAAGGLDMQRVAMVDKLAVLEQQFAALGEELAQLRSALINPKES
jgi:hypothetical protein